MAANGVKTWVVETDSNGVWHIGELMESGPFEVTGGRVNGGWERARVER